MSSVGTYSLKPVTVQALQWSGTNVGEMTLFADFRFQSLDEPDGNDPDATAGLLTSENNTWELMYTGDWVVKSDNGFVFRLSDEKFREKYENRAATWLESVYVGPEVSVIP